MPTVFIRLLLLLALLPASVPALARVEVQAVQHKREGRILAARVTEDIAPGDYEKLLQGVLANPGRFGQKIVLLDSIGGSVPEAIRMGRLLREMGFDARVPANAVCQGTCVYLLAAGQQRSVLGYVGIHRPYFPRGDSAAADAADNRHSYSTEAYFREMDIAPALAAVMRETPPGQMRVLTAGELTRYRLD